MVPTVVVERVTLPGRLGHEMVLAQRGDQFSIRVAGIELMNSVRHGSEDALGALSAERVRGTGAPRVLIGGLGLGYTLRAALDALPPNARVDLVEIVPAVVRWNRTIVAALARRPLDDPRVTVIEDDVARVIGRSAPAGYDAIVLDVDNGPDEVIEDNDALYRRAGLAAARAALAPHGVLAVWSAFKSPTFTRWLRDAGFIVELETIRSRGSRHWIWFAHRT